MIINKGSLTALFQGFKVIFNKAFEGSSSDWQKLAMLVSLYDFAGGLCLAGSHHRLS